MASVSGSCVLLEILGDPPTESCSFLDTRGEHSKSCDPIVLLDLAMRLTPPPPPLAARGDLGMGTGLPGASSLSESGGSGEARRGGVAVLVVLWGITHLKQTNLRSLETRLTYDTPARHLTQLTDTTLKETHLIHLKTPDT